MDPLPWSKFMDASASHFHATKNLCKIHQSYFRNIESHPLPNEILLVKLDMASKYSTRGTTEIKCITRNFWKALKNLCRMKPISPTILYFCAFIKLILERNCCCFQWPIYITKIWMSLWEPILTLSCDIVMHRLENKVIPTCPTYENGFFTGMTFDCFIKGTALELQV